jgi:hypothetical protein
MTKTTKSNSHDSALPSCIMQGAPDGRHDLHVNWLLYRELALGGTENSFKSYWDEKFKALSSEGIAGWLQLNFPGVPLSDLLDLVVKLTYKVVCDGTRQVVFKWVEHFSDTYLEDANEVSDWVSLVLKNQEIPDGADVSLFGLTKKGMPYDDVHTKGEQTQRELALRLIKEAEGAKPGLQFLTTTPRQRVISLLLDLICLTNMKVDETVCQELRVRPGYVCRDMSGRSRGDSGPDVYCGGNRCVHLDKGADVGRSFCGFGLLAEEKS